MPTVDQLAREAEGRSERRRRTALSSGFRAIVITISLAVLVVAMVVAYAIWRVASQAPFQTAINASTVVRNVRELRRLETVVYTLDQVITGERKNALLPPSLAGDRLLLIVHGDVTAGVDLSHLSAADVSIKGKAIRIKLPAAEIFATRIDSQKTRVFSRETGLFSAADPDLESEVRRNAEAQLTRAALDDGILQTADQNARGALGALLHSLGFEELEIVH